jgi:hypothetical protein
MFGFEPEHIVEAATECSGASDNAGRWGRPGLALGSMVKGRNR